MKTGIGALQEE